MSNRTLKYLIGWLLVAGCAAGTGLILAPAIKPAPLAPEEGSGGASLIVVGLDSVTVYDEADAGEDTAPAGWTWVDGHWVDGSGYVVEASGVSP